MAKKRSNLQMQKHGANQPRTIHKPKPEIKTYWNGFPCSARKVRVVVGGVEQEAVEVKDANQFGPQPFYLADEDGTAWAKVTIGWGLPMWPHTSLLDVERVIEPEPPPTFEFGGDL